MGSGSATADISESSAGEVKICQMFRARSALFSLQNVLEMEYLYLKALMLGMAFAFGLGGRHLARRLLESLLGQKEKAKHEEPQPL